jgi:hypothetical protein
MKHPVGLSLLEMTLLIGGAELFFRFSDYAVLKGFALVSMASAIVMLGCSRSGGRCILWKIGVAAYRVRDLDRETPYCLIECAGTFRRRMGAWYAT